MKAVRTEVRIRRATAQEEDIFVRLAHGLTQFNRKNGPEIHDEEKVLREREEQSQKVFRRQQEDENQIILFAEVDREVVGYILGRIYRPSLATETLDPVVGHVDELFVDPRIRAQGLGKKLLQAISDWMKNEGATRMTLSMYAWNDDAERFYRKAGFEMYDVTWQKEID